MKIVHVHRMRGVGGSERHLLTLLPALAARGHDVQFVGLDDPEWDAAPFYEQLGVPARRLTAPGDVHLGVGRALRAELVQLRADVVHTHLVHADVYGALASLRAEWALVSTKHNDDPFRTGPFRFVERRCTQRADRVIAITHALARFNAERVGLPRAKIDVVHYGVDATPPPWGPGAPPPERRYLLAIARLVEQKGIDVAVRALPQIRRVHGDVVLAVLGEGPQRDALQRLAVELGVADALVLPGRVGDVAAWLARAELLVHPARWEGFGLALLEAMLARRAVVATSVSSIPEIVRDGVTGLLVRPDDPTALAEAIGRVLQDASFRDELGSAGLERARSEFSVARMVDATLAAYERALGARRNCR